VDEDVELLEREIQSVIKNKAGTAVGGKRERIGSKL
jgi:hypothetical protein